MTSICRIATVLVLCLCCAATSLAIAPVGNIFDGVMSLVYDPVTGDIVIEHLPVPSPSLSHLVIQSGGGLLIPGARNIPSLSSPPVLVNGVANGPGSIHMLDLHRPGFNFLGTGWSLGPILPSGLPIGQLELDLTIQWAPVSNPLFPGDMLYGTFGNTQGNPVLPGNQTNGVWQFTGAQSGQFFDPPMAYGFLYEMTDGSLFTRVGLPLGLGNNFTITSSEPTVTGLTEGSQHTFTSGVSSFTITGINPLVDENSPTAFPVYLEFNNSIASFNMTPLTVPEPSSVLLVLSLLPLVSRRGRTN